MAKAVYNYVKQTDEEFELEEQEGMNDYLEKWKKDNPALNQKLQEEILELIENEELQTAIALSLSEIEEEQPALEQAQAC